MPSKKQIHSVLQADSAAAQKDMEQLVWEVWEAVNVFLNDVIPDRRPTQRRHSRTGSSCCGRCGRWWTANSWTRGIMASTAAPGLPRATPHYWVGKTLLVVLGFRV